MTIEALDYAEGEGWAMFNGDCVEVMAQLPEHSVGYSIFSPPFASLYTYSNSPRDMGNVRDDAEFFDHLDFLIAELRRVMKPRLLAVFVAVVSSGIIAIGYLFNLVI